jgi:hypothetical protein
MKRLHSARRRLADPCLFAVSTLERHFTKGGFLVHRSARSKGKTEIRTGQAPAEQVLKYIRRQTRRQYQVFREEKRKAAQQLELPFVTIIRKL